ncbi:MAG: HK97 family phage prohead protease, partial [Phycisphaerales bacterium]
DDEYFYFEGHAAVFNNIDRGGDRIVPGAFRETLSGGNSVKILWQHKMSEPLGIPVDMHEDSKGLFVRGKMPKEDTLVKGRVIPQMKIGAVNTLSIGYRVLEYNTEKTEDEGTIWNLTKLELYEFSPVSIPMNPEATITGWKAVTRFKNLPLADRKQKWSRSAAVRNIREHTGSKEKPSRSYRNYFMWFDSENADNFGAYKLPYADWLDGGFKAVPRALIAIKAAIGGARGGVDIPETDKPKILRHVERYLSKLENSEKIFILSDVEDIEAREDFNDFLKETGLFSKQAREKLSSFLPGRSNSEPTKDIFEKFTKTLEEATMRKT